LRIPNEGRDGPQYSRSRDRRYELRRCEFPNSARKGARRNPRSGQRRLFAVQFVEPVFHVAEGAEETEPCFGEIEG
jgi:hypothetical protein